MPEALLSTARTALQRTLEGDVFLEGLSPLEGFLLLLFGGLILIYCLRRFGQLASLGVDDQGRELGTWAAREFFELCAFALVLLAFLDWLMGDRIGAGGLGALNLQAVWMLLCALVASGLAWQSDGRAGLRALGMGRAPLQITGEAGMGHLRAILLGLSAYLLLFPFLLGIYLYWPMIAKNFEIVVDDQDILTEILALQGGALALALFIAGVLGPLTEEVLFRGFLQPILVRGLGALGGILLTSILFAMLHGSEVFLPIFVFSLLLGWVQLRARCLWATWAVHAGHNSLILSFYLLSS